MLGSVVLKTLRDLRRGFAYWSLGLVALVALHIGVYPSVRDNPALNELAESYPEAIKGFIGFGGELDWVSGPGYLGAELYSFVAPLLLLIVAVGAGSRALAGEEEQGTLELLLSLPVSRVRVALEKLAALVAEVVGLGLVLLVSLWIGVAAIDMGVSLAHLVSATLSAVLLAVGFGAIALAAGAATGRRSLAIAVSSAGAVAAYVVNSLAPLVGELEALQKVSPFYFYSASDPLRHGLDAVYVLALLGIVVVAGIAALVAADRRDLAA
jgi:ABC-2 type transport system permease protein